MLKNTKVLGIRISLQQLTRKKLQRGKVNANQQTAYCKHSPSCSFLPSKARFRIWGKLLLVNTPLGRAPSPCWKQPSLASLPELSLQVSTFAIWHTELAQSLIYSLMLLSFKSTGISYTQIPYWLYKYQDATVKFKLNIEVIFLNNSQLQLAKPILFERKKQTPALSSHCN